MADLALVGVPAGVFSMGGMSLGGVSKLGVLAAGLPYYLHTGLNGPFSWFMGISVDLATRWRHDVTLAITVFFLRHGQQMESTGWAVCDRHGIA